MKQDLELFLKRVAFKNNYTTIGRLKFNGYDEHNNIVEDNKSLCDTLEPSKISRMLIPTGKYKIIVNHSNMFNRDLPLLLNVAGFTGVRVHRENTAKDTKATYFPERMIKLVGSVILRNTNKRL
ncbi:MAG: DUF5675 family protein [Endomicrobium sp.]|uniref:DUF5675 family protein n=1 Tax=Candidatus Endomicrobiellum pyrsonymphae TaxID=1408203 RepID=UPI0035884D3C|nr:DUF5675 family protein [Endomicrobium sp.]